MQTKRINPRCPTFYWTLDGWTVELLYQSEKINEKGKRYTDYNGRVALVAVLDPFNKYPVGYAIGDRETPELIKAALRNALDHIATLFGKPDTGGLYTAHQLQSDNYQIKNLTPFYQAASHVFTPAGVGVSNAKVIEPWFKYMNKQYCQAWSNWSGFGVTARKSNQVNAEYLDKIKCTFPNKDGVMLQVHEMISLERTRLIEEYTASWHNMPSEERTIISRENVLLLFGEPIGKTNQITGLGIVKEIGNVKYTYNSFEPLFRQNMHLGWQLYLDREDMTRVLAVSPDQKLRFVLKEVNGLPMDLRSRTEEHHRIQARIQRFNKDAEQSIMQLYAQDAEIMEETLNSTPLELSNHDEATLKLMFTDQKGTQKERIQDAKGLKAAQKKEVKRIAAEQKQEAVNWLAIQQRYNQQHVNFKNLKFD